MEGAATDAAFPRPDGGRPTARELALLGLVIACGLALRAWALSSVALQHYDEGTFALAGMVIATTGVPPAWLANFSPPVFPALLAGIFTVLGPSDTAILALNVLFSTLTILAAWWAARRWFGPAAGVAAATLLALNEFDVALARSGLTDTLFAFLFLVAIVGVYSAFRKPSVRSTIWAGILVGLAWNTKYHGWFVLVVAALALLGDAALRRRWRAEPWVRVLLPMTAVAGLCFLPWALFVHAPTGSFAEIIAHYRSFLSLNPIHNVVQYARDQAFFEGPLTRASVPAALLMAALLSPRRRLTPGFWLLVCGAAALALAIGGNGATLVLAVAAVPLLVREKTGLAGMLLVAWMGLWVFAAPFYHAYARLLLPLTVAAAMAAGAFLAWTAAGGAVAEGGGAPNATRARRAVARPVLAAAVTLATWAVALLRPAPGDPWRPTPQMRQVAADVAAAVPRGAPLSVLGEPALQFYLYRLGRTSSASLTPAGRAGRKETFVAVGWYSTHIPKAAELLHSGILGKPVATFPFVPNDIRLLDDYGAPEARRYRKHPSRWYQVRLYRLVNAKAPPPAARVTRPGTPPPDRSARHGVRAADTPSSPRRSGRGPRPRT